MRVMTVCGTRPEIIRLSEIVKGLDRFCEHVLVHTGQNHDPLLSEVFFRDLELRQPDVHLGIDVAGFPEQAGQILTRIGAEFERLKPERVLILGDTNSGLAAIVAARLRIPVFHMEAGNRCYDDRVPEEINRRVIDHCSTILLPYTERSKENLVREGIDRDRIFITGNPIFEVLETHREKIDRSPVLGTLGLEPDGYVLVTLHRAENVDVPGRLKSFLDALSRVAEEQQCPVVVSVHPRTANRLDHFQLAPSSSRVRLIAPLGFLDFVKLERHARVVLSDSGTVQEECAILQVPNCTLRDVTERPETVECGSNILTGADPEDVLRGVRLALAGGRGWIPPPEYLARDVSRTVIRILLGVLSLRRHGA